MLRTVIDGTLLACCLGIAMDLVTANVAVDYFTVVHPKMVESKSPWVMALVWGVAASWWFGAGAGFILGIVNARRKFPLSPRRIRGEFGRACIALWFTLMMILAATYLLIGLMPAHLRRPTFDYDRRMMAVALTHLTEYALGLVALIVVAIRIRRAPGE